MASAVKLTDELVETAREQARIMKRSLAKQIEYWAELGLAIERSGQFSMAQVEQFLRGRQPYDSLTAEEQAVARHRIEDRLDSLDDQPSEFFAELRRTGVPYSGYREEDPGTLVTVHPDGTEERQAQPPTLPSRAAE